MIKNYTRLECMVNEKSAHFYCEMDTPLDVVKEMLFQFQKLVGHVEDQVRSNQEEQKKLEESFSEMSTQESEET